MENFSTLVSSAAVSGIVGLVVPFLLPFVFRLFKRELTGDEKRLLITLFSFTVSVIVLAFKYDWTGDLMSRISDFAVYLFINFTAFRAMVQTVYDLIIKSFPAIDNKLTSIYK